MQLTRPMIRAVIRAGRRLAADQGGVAAVEFALLVPILCLLYFGMDELTQGVMAERRASHTASTIGDLVAQSSTITQAEVADIFNIGDTVTYPFPTAPLSMRITSVVTDKNNNATVAWSQAIGLTALTKGNSVSISSNVISANQSVIMAEATYVYTPAVGYVLHTPLTFHETYYLRPRLSSQVTCADC
jgi:Flp pilus assembly protein TadG